MEFDRWRLRDWVVAVWTVTLICLALLTIYPGISVAWGWAKDNASNIASWVQAIGSILAIWGAFRIASYQVDVQRDRDRESERQSKRRKYMLLYDRFLSCSVLTTAQLNSISLGMRSWKSHLMSTESVLNLLIDLTVEDLPDIELVTDVTNIRIRLESLRYVFSDCIDRNDEYTTPLNEITKAITDLQVFALASADTCVRRMGDISTIEEQRTVLQHVNDLQRALKAATVSRGA